MNNDAHDRHYDQVYAQDNPVPTGEAHGSIQWKGTEVCMDISCKCGHHSHFDGEFFYYFECPKCKAKYAVGQNVKLIPLNAEQADFVVEKLMGFNTCELENQEGDNS